MSQSSDDQLKQAEVANAFSRAACSYDSAAVLQQAVGRCLLERLQWIRIDPACILELGAGTGYVSRLLEKQYRKSALILLDIAENMLVVAKQRARWLTHQRYLCADATRLPLKDASVDLIFSNLMFQWITDLPALLRELRRVLRPGGLLMFSSFGPDTLKELRQSWSAVDTSVHVHTHPDMHDVGDCLVEAQWVDPVLDVDYFTVTYATVHQLMRALKAIGAGNLAAGRCAHLTGKHRLQKMVEAYEQFRLPDGSLPATYEVVYGHAWAPTRVMQPGDGTVVIDSEKIQRRRE